MDSTRPWERQEPSGSSSYDWPCEREPGSSSNTDQDQANSEESDFVIVEGPSNHEREESRSISKIIEELNRRLRSVIEEAGRPYGPDVNEQEEIVRRFATATRLCKERVSCVLREIEKSAYVQLCFLVDATASMKDHIDGVRRSIKQIVGSSDLQDMTKKMQVAFVAYRDHDDKNQFEVLPFTELIPQFEGFCKAIKASGGGGDAMEDVFGGLENVLSLKWSPNAGTKVLFHICDYPCHGAEFSDKDDDLLDSYPAGDPNGRTHTDLFGLLRDMGIQYYFGRITKYTDTMIKKFSEAYKEQIVHFDVTNVDNITQSVTQAISLSVSNAIEATKQLTRPGMKETTFTLELAEPDWDNCSIFKGKLISYQFPPSIQSVIDGVPLKMTSTSAAEIKIAANPFAKGAEKVAFYGQDVSLVEGQGTDKQIVHVVLKEYRHQEKNIAKNFEDANQMQTIAAFLAKKFVEKIKEMPGVRAIEFIKIHTLSLSTEPGKVRYLSAEKRFSREEKFIRFSNNAGYELMKNKALDLGVSLDFVQLVTAFSHWTHKVTNGYLMVVDLEGVVANVSSMGEIGVLLTDPAIHCKDYTRFGPMNHGLDGMNNFFSKHQCNKYCNYFNETCT